MNTNNKLAIIVPIYNVERYIGECLTSITKQSFNNWVCYLVNDGTPDKSAEIAESFAQHDARFVVIHKENGGVSSARNAGVKVALQEDFEYIYFLDPDDLLPPNYFEEMLSAIEKDNSDFSICPTRRFDKSGPIEFDSPYPKEILTIEGDQIADLYFQSGKKEAAFDCKRFVGNKIFRKKSIHRPLFREDMASAEDQDWIIDNLLTLKKATFTPRTEFLYRLRGSSLSHSSSTLQDYDTFYRILNTTLNDYSPVVQKWIKERFIETLYNQIILDITTNQNRDSIKGKISDGISTLSKVDNRSRITLGKNKYLRRLIWWPFSFFVYYSSKRVQKKQRKTSHIDFFK